MDIFGCAVCAGLTEVVAVRAQRSWVGDFTTRGDVGAAWVPLDPAFELNEPSRVRPLFLPPPLRRDGFAACCEVWPGNTADMKTVLPALKRLKERFRIRRVIFVCDRGMVSKENLEELTAAVAEAYKQLTSI